MFCSQCGAKLSDEAKFCSSCGKETPERQPAVAAEAPAPPGQVASTGSPNLVAPTPPFKSAWFWCLMVVQVLLLGNLLPPAMTGHLADKHPGAGSLWLINVALFALAWNRMKRRAWIGALIGLAATFALYVVAGFVAGYVHRGGA
jgi:zinc ribbon protein